jgi:hypothetical protein
VTLDQVSGPRRAVGGNLAPLGESAPAPREPSSHSDDDVEAELARVRAVLDEMAVTSDPLRARELAGGLTGERPPRNSAKVGSTGRRFVWPLDKGLPEVEVPVATEQRQSSLWDAREELRVSITPNRVVRGNGGPRRAIPAEPDAEAAPAVSVRRPLLPARWRQLWTSVVLGLAGAAVMVLRTVWPFTLGQGPHPDGDRYLCQLAANGMVPANADAPRYWSFALFEWVPAASPTGDCIAYPSSEIWLLRFVQWVTQLTGGAEGALSLRWLVLLNCLVVGVLVSLFAYAVRGRLWVRIVVPAVFLLVIGDSLFASYAGSPLGEYPGLVGVMLIAVGAVYLARAGVRQWLGLALVGIGGLLAVTSKVQTITLLVPIAVILLATAMRRRRPMTQTDVPDPDVRDSQVRQIVRAVVRRLAPLAVLLSLLAPALWVQSNNPKFFQAVNAWELISVGILPYSADPASDLTELGFPASLADQAGRTAGQEPFITNRADWMANTDKMSFANVGMFLLRHPGKAFTVANVAAQDFFVTRAHYLGSYEPGTEHTEQQQDFSPVTFVNTQLGASGVLVWAFLWSGLLVGAVALRRSSAPDTWKRGFANAALLMLSFALVQFVTAAFGEAIENTRHMIYALLAAFLVPVFLVAGVCWREWHEENDVPSGAAIGGRAAAGD